MIEGLEVWRGKSKKKRPPCTTRSNSERSAAEKVKKEARVAN